MEHNTPPELYLPDFALLRAVALTTQPPTRRELWSPRGEGLWNKELAWFVERGMATAVTSYRRFPQAVKRLRGCGLMEENSYQLTPEGFALLDELGARNRWPLIVPVEDGKPQVSKGERS